MKELSNSFNIMLQFIWNFLSRWTPFFLLVRESVTKIYKIIVVIEYAELFIFFYPRLSVYLFLSAFIF